MPPIPLNRRRFLGASAAAGIALSQGRVGEAAAAGDNATVRVGVVGVGSRGTTLLRTLLELPGVIVPAVCDPEAKHRLRGQGIVEKAKAARPEGYDRVEKLLERDDLDAVVVAIPCDLHAAVSSDVLRGQASVHGKAARVDAE